MKIFSIALLFVLSACDQSNTISQNNKLSSDEPPTGGDCTYKSVDGIATITSVSLIADPYNCRTDPVEIRFDFVANDPSKDFEIPYNPNNFTFDGGRPTSKRWAEENGLTVGSRHTAIKKLITYGTCTPVSYDFSDINSVQPLNYCS